MRKHLLLCCFILLGYTLFGQLNLRVGYSLGFFEPVVTNDILADYNQNTAWLDESFKSIRLVNGLTFGARYRFGAIGFEGFWSNKFLQRTASGVNPADNRFTSQQLNLSINSYSGGAQIYFSEHLSIGGSVDATHYQARRSTNINSAKTTILREFTLSSHLYFSAELRSSPNVAISFRPYVFLPWGELDMIPFGEALGSSGTGQMRENLFHYGIMLVFCNGPQ